MPEPVPHSGKMIDPLTGVRALALAFVVLFHFQTDLYVLIPGSEHLRAVIGLAPLGPDLFFMLSGFVLCLRYADEFGGRARWVDLREYAVMRVARIYPVHLLTLNLMVVLVVGARLAGLTIHSETLTSFDVSSYLQNVVLVHAWFGQRMSWNYPAWSVSVEWFAYAFFPLVVLVVSRVVRRWIAWSTAVALLLAFWLYAHQTALESVGTGLHGVLLRGSVDFVAGCLVYRVSVLTPTAGRWWRAVPPLALLTLVAGAYLVPRDLDLLLPVLPLVLFSLARNGGTVARILSTRVFVRLGLMSYSLYLVHALVLTGSSRATQQIAGAPLVVRIGYVVAVVVAILVLGYVVHRFVEEPARRAIIRRFGRRRTPRPAGPAEQAHVHVPSPSPAPDDLPTVRVPRGSDTPR